MSSRNLDELVEKEFEAINVVIDGKTYTVGKITGPVMDSLAKADDGANVTGMCSKLAQLLGVRENTFNDTDVRKIIAAMTFITEEVTKQLNTLPSNPLGAGATPSA